MSGAPAAEAATQERQLGIEELPAAAPTHRWERSTKRGQNTMKQQASPSRRVPRGGGRAQPPGARAGSVALEPKWLRTEVTRRTNGRTGGRTNGQTDGRTDGRVDGRTGGQTGGRMDGWDHANEQTAGRTHGRTDERAHGRTGGRTDGWTNGRTDGRADGRAEGRTDARMELLDVWTAYATSIIVMAHPLTRQT